MPTPLPQDTGGQSTNENASEASQNEDEEVEFSQRRLKKKFKKRQNTTGITYVPYLNASAWLQRSYGMDLIWAGILMRGIAWDFKVFNPYTKPQYEEKFRSQISHYNVLMERVPGLATDQEILRRDATAIELLGANMVDSANQARSNDIFSLKDKFLQYLALELPSGAAIPTRPDKSDRGFKNRFTAELLVPGILRSQFDKDPDSMMAELLNGTPQHLEDDEDDGREVPINEEEFPSFMWPAGGFVAGVENREVNLLQSRILVRVYRHIFTTPSSALKDLNDTITKSVQGMAKKEKMTNVMPASIAYACVMLRHAATCTTSWDQHDRSFNYQRYFAIVVALFDKDDEDADIEWIHDTLKWWDTMIFGMESPNYDGSNLMNSKKRSASNSTLDEIKKLRKAKKQRRIEERQAEGSQIPASSALQPTLPPPESTQHPEPSIPSSSSSVSNGPLTSPLAHQGQPRLQPLGPSNVMNSLLEATPPPNQLARAPRLAQQSGREFSQPESPEMYSSALSYSSIDPQLRPQSSFHSHAHVPPHGRPNTIDHPQSHRQPHASEYSSHPSYHQTHRNPTQGLFRPDQQHHAASSAATAHSARYQPRYDENAGAHYPQQSYE
ncbi:hypothetical protein BJ165DRAFT_1534448 [Panaeolus papilionaceus]|nr:hypothetical protein BJ165DRAFT_1534448 [Panaeolus papilionaceus]